MDAVLKRRVELPSSSRHRDTHLVHEHVDAISRLAKSLKYEQRIFEQLVHASVGVRQHGKRHRQEGFEVQRIAGVVRLEFGQRAALA